MLDRPKLLQAVLSASNFEKHPSLQNMRNNIIAKAIEGIYTAGETLDSARKHMETLEKNCNIGTILNYAMEAGKWFIIKNLSNAIF